MPAIYPHQQSALDRFVEAESGTGRPLAILLAGSIAKGWHNQNSDVDVLYLESDEANRARRASGPVCVWDERFLEGGCGVDVKYTPISYLDEAEARGNEPTRAAFLGVSVAYADTPVRKADLEARIARITAYPEDGVHARIVSYLGQVEAMTWYIGEAAKRDDPYLASWVASRAVLFGARAILAHNRVLFPFHKWLLKALETCPVRPGAIVTLAHTATREPTKPNVTAFCEAILEMDVWPSGRPGWGDLFHHDTELAWQRGIFRLEDG
ncbi:MAG: hypothetical protein ACF8Q5_08970 [Phycisphaerales bacterium JB040]